VPCDRHFNLCDEIMKLIETIQIGDQFKALFTDGRVASADTYVAPASMCLNCDGSVTLSALPITLLRTDTCPLCFEQYEFSLMSVERILPYFLS
jgi:hypothetical protein